MARKKSRAAGAGVRKPKTFNGDLSKLPKPLAHLAQQKIWVCWRWTWKKGKWTKPPFRADNTTINASTSDPRTWGSYEMALKQVLAGKADGLGPAVKGSGISGVDLDHCRNPTTGKIAPWAQEYLDRFPTAYVEATVSGKGLRILGTSDIQNFAPKFKLPSKGNGAAVELFSNSTHYLTLSCNQIGRCRALPPIGEQMAAIAAELGNGVRKPQPDDNAASGDDASDELPFPWSFENELRLRSALAAIPTDEQLLIEKLGGSHMPWVNIGRAIERLGWRGGRGYAVFRDWSSQSEKFDEKGLQAQWESFHRNRNSRKKPVTIKTVFFYAREFGWYDDQADAIEFKIKPKANPAGNSKAAPSARAVTTQLRSARVSAFKRKAIKWLWQGRFAIGKLGIIAGLPDEGKGNLICYIAARITRGGAWPCGEGDAPLQGNVILLTAEDDIEDTVRPRLEAAGADIDRVEIIQMVQEKGQDRMFSLITDLSLLRQKIIEVGGVWLVLIDPISAYLGVKKMDSFRTTDVRAVLAPLVDLAREMQVSIIGIMHFNKKTDVDSVLLRISDSLAFGATARHAYAVVDDAENDRKLFVKGKNNNAPKNQKALAFTFDTQRMQDEETGELFEVPYIVWQAEPVDITASEAMRAVAGSKTPTARSEAKTLLQYMLANGPVDRVEIEEAAEANGISERTLWRAKSELNIIAEKKKGEMAKGWTWRLPDETDLVIQTQSSLFRITPKADETKGKRRASL